MDNNNQILTKEQLEAYLGRPLTPTEGSNINIYLELAILRLKDLICVEDLPDDGTIPADEALLLARLFAVITEEQKSANQHGVSNKKVEDFSISYDVSADSPMSYFIKENYDTLMKYSQCQGKIMTGDIRRGECFRCI